MLAKITPMHDVTGKSPMDEKTNALRTRFDAFSRRLHDKIHEFKTTGRLGAESEETENIRKRHVAMQTKLDGAIRAGAVADIIRLEFERDLDGLLGEFLRLEKEFDAAAIGESKSKTLI
jgi:hypothetical protein